MKNLKICKYIDLNRNQGETELKNGKRSLYGNAFIKDDFVFGRLSKFFTRWGYNF